jgi:hypothetical protein
MSANDASLAAAAGVLSRRGWRGCTVGAGGLSGEVLLVTAPAASSVELLADRQLLDDLRGTGFRYVALDLAPRAEQRPQP